MKRTQIKDTVKKVGEDVRLCGFIHTVRFHGSIIFLDIRDRSGIVQTVMTSKCDNYTNAKEIRPEWVVEIIGKVKERPEKMRNASSETGAIEIEISKITILSKAKTIPFSISDDGYSINEETRLKYRYIDLRRERLQKNIKIRSDYVQGAREFLIKEEFWEIETPILTKATPEGSRDFVVPSRVYPGKFYALPQSPQQYKQLLMIAGFEKYFQVAKALRDEDLRANRALEHTQIDLEMSFVEQKDVMNVVEQMTIYALEKIGAKIAKKPFPVITYKEAMEKYGADKFDPRTEKEKQENVMSFAWVIDFPFFEKDKQGKWTFTHNPFSAPLNKEHEEWLLKGENIENILTSQYDLVCNGLEVSGGSIRTNKEEVLRSTFKIMGYEDKEINEKFGHILEAFSYGAPPHGGCAQGFERILMAYLGEEYLREVQAFPQTGQGRTAVMDGPSDISKEQLEELRIKIDKK